MTTDATDGFVRVRGANEHARRIKRERIGRLAATPTGAGEPLTWINVPHRL